MKKSFLFLACFFLVFSFLAQGKVGDRDFKELKGVLVLKKLPFFAVVLDLSDDQLSRLQDIKANLDKAKRNKAKTVKDLKEQLAKRLEAGAEPSEIGNILINIHNLKQSMKADVELYAREVEEVLSESQLQKLNKLVELRREKKNKHSKCKLRKGKSFDHFLM